MKLHTQSLWPPAGVPDSKNSNARKVNHMIDEGPMLERARREDNRRMTSAAALSGGPSPLSCADISRRLHAMRTDFDPALRGFDATVLDLVGALNQHHLVIATALREISEHEPAAITVPTFNGNYILDFSTKQEYSSFLLGKHRPTLNQSGRSKEQKGR